MLMVEVPALPLPHELLAFAANRELDSHLRSSRGSAQSLEGFSLKDHEPLELTVAGRYRVKGFLGEGGTALVYLARDLEQDRLVVVKQMKESVASSSELRTRFMLEARALSCVDHPSVVRVLDLGDPEDEAPYLVLEALRGESLGDYLRREGTMELELAVPLLVEAGKALAAVHDAQMVHRDVKPDNLFLVGPIGEPHSLKVLDFGMAQLSDEVADSESTSILGTAQYMAPEQILVEPIDGRTDVYALGVVLFRALTGHLPFEAQNKSDLLRHQLFSPLPPATWLDETLPDLMVKIIQRASRKAPEARFLHMTEMVEALELLLPGSEENERPLFPIASWEGPDVYDPVTARGRKAARILAADFGVYAHPHDHAAGDSAASA